jgi:hypothetical protein
MTKFTLFTQIFRSTTSSGIKDNAGNYFYNNNLTTHLYIQPFINDVLQRIRYSDNYLCFRFIDVSQSVEPNHPHGLEFLYRDCKNISDFFTNKGVHQCLTPGALFTSITGLPIDETQSEAEILTQVDYFV